MQIQKKLLVISQSIVLLLLFAPLFAKAQYNNNTHKEIIRVHKNGTGFSRQVVSHFSFPSKEKRLIDIPFNQLEKVRKLNISYTIPNGKKRKIAKKHILKRSLTSNTYYDGMQAMSYQFEPNLQTRNVQIEYQKICSELFFLSKLPFTGHSFSQTVPVSYTHLTLPTILRV